MREMSRSQTKMNSSKQQQQKATRNRKKSKINK